MNQDLVSTDAELFSLLEKEAKRQDDYLTLIPSENYTHPAVMAAMGSVCTNKYSEGYPGKRYYNGNIYIDQIENLARDRAKELFSAEFANVQAYSGSPANLAVYFALLEPGDRVMGLELSHGGHLTHGAKVSFSGKWFQQQPIMVGDNDSIDYDQVEAEVAEFKPKMIIAGITAYPIELDYERLVEIAHKNGAYLVADVSHTNGLVLAGIHRHPLKLGADVMTTTTHKLLRGPRGALVLTNNSKLARKIDKAIMPGLQGGPHNQQTAAIAVALKQAQTDDYRDYVKRVHENAQAMATVLLDSGIKLVSGGTENHLMLVDLRDLGISGKLAADRLEEAQIVANANSIPNDPAPPLKPSGIRIGTPAITSRGFTSSDSAELAKVIADVLQNIEDDKVIAESKSRVQEWCGKYPVLS